MIKRIVSAAFAAAFCVMMLLTLASCTVHYTSELPVSAKGRIEIARKDYRLDSDAGILQSDAGTAIFDNRYDAFAPGYVIVNNSDYTVKEETVDRIFSDLEAYRYMSGFYAIDLETRMSVGYNADEKFFTASTVKAGYALYCFKSIASGNGSYTDTVKFQRKHTCEGSGSIQRSEFGTAYTIKNLLYHMIYESDNCAYYMLIDYFGLDGYNEMVKGLGVDHVLTPESKWGYLSPHELGLIWNEIYNFRDECEEGALLWRYLTTNQFNELAVELTEYSVIAHKSGWGYPGYHDSGVVCAEHDYVIVVMTDTSKKNYCFYELTRRVDDIMRDYWNWLEAERN